MPLAAHGLFANLGVNWGNSLLGFVSLLFLPLPPLLYYVSAPLHTVVHEERGSDADNSCAVGGNNSSDLG